MSVRLQDRHLLIDVGLHRQPDIRGLSTDCVSTKIRAEDS